MEFEMIESIEILVYFRGDKEGTRYYVHSYRKGDWTGIVEAVEEAKETGYLVFEDTDHNDIIINMDNVDLIKL